MYVLSINYYARSESSDFENFVSMYNFHTIILFNAHRKDGQYDRPFRLSGTLNPMSLKLVVIQFYFHKRSKKILCVYCMPLEYLLIVAYVIIRIWTCDELLLCVNELMEIAYLKEKKCRLSIVLDIMMNFSICANH